MSVYPYAGKCRVSMSNRNPSHEASSRNQAVDRACLGIAILNRDEILACNPRFQEIAGFDGAEGRLEPFLQWIAPAYRESFVLHLEALLQGELTRVGFELSGGPVGAGRLFLGDAQRILFAAGFPAVHLTLKDLGGLAVLQSRSNENDGPQVKVHHDDRLAVLGSMAAGIAHELNQPLNTIRVVTDGLLFGRSEGWSLDQEELFEDLEMISRQVVRMDKVIQTVRNFARGERGRADESVHVNVAVENVLTMIGRQIEAHGIRLEKDLDPELPPIRAILNELEQVVMNLIVNARQALDECARPRKLLSIRTGSRDGTVFIEVSDNGPGIAEPLLERIFDPFFTTKEVGHGTGLGLSISQSIVRNLGGRIDAANNGNGGATFVIHVPAAREET